MRSKSGLLLIDGTGLLVRSQLAVRPDEERAEDLALFFFVRSVIRFIKHHDPVYVLVAWDGEDAKAWRRSLYPEYKANRAPAASGRYHDDKLGYRATSFLLRTGMYSVRQSFEADDTIAWAAWRSQLNNLGRVWIRSDDADLNQLIVGETITQHPLSGLEYCFDQEAVKDKYGCLPHQLPVLRALAGDSSDNIPGLPGVGIKTAAKLCEKAGFEIGCMEHRTLDDPDLRNQLRVYRRIMDLRERREDVHTAMGRPHNLGLLCSWDKTAATEPAMRCFAQWDMKTLLTQAESGTLW